ncbi:MAG: hypothetical protein K2Q10_00785, partial [Rhodospirillales bacterium]|nr:hypothetical protein [Rhodospirillales bacterium]
ARFLEGHAVRVVESTDTVVQYAAKIVETVERSAWSGNRVLWEQLRSLAAAVPEVGVLWIVDAEGTIALNSFEFPSARIDVTDREYFTVHRDGDPAVHIGPTVQSRISGTFFFAISRPILGHDGTFLGVAVASVEVGNFLDFQHHYGLGQGSTFLVARADGMILVRQPHHPNAYGQRMSTLAEYAAASSAATIEVQSPIDGVQRILSYRRNNRYPMLVAVSVAKGEILVSWWREVLYALTGAGFIAILVGAAALLAWRSSGREEAALAALKQSNAELESRVTERTAALAEALRDARRANDTKSRFMAAASHDLRQPLHALRLFLDVLAEIITEPRQHAVLSRAIEAMNRAEHLLAALLEVSRLEAGVILPAVTDFAVIDILAPLAIQAKSQASQAGLKFHYRPCTARVRSDPALLQRIVGNLLANALRYTRKGGVLLACRRHGNMLTIGVWDTGPGIPPEKQKVIFEDFYQLDARQEHVQGLGLGLPIVERLARLLGHPLEMRSHPGKGSVFSVRVPLG